MKIIISERKIQKPLDKPIMTSVNRNNQSIVAIKQPNVLQGTISTIVEEVKSEQKEPLLPMQKTILKFAPTTHKYIHITPHASVKNDKVDLFINSYSENHRELYANLFKIKMSEKGLHIPSQDKVFFELVIKRETFNNYITSNEEVFDYTHQQLHYTWNAVIKEESKDHLVDTLSTHSVGYDFKLKYTSALAIETGSQNYHEKPLREFLELARTLMKDEKVIIQFGFQPSEKEWYKEGAKTVKELPKRKIISESSKMKLGYNGFDCVIRLIVTGNTSSRIEQIATGYIFALKQLNGDNELIEKKVKHKKFDSWYEKYVLQRKIPIPFSFNKRIILTEKEMKHFIKMPQSNLQKEFNLQSVERVESDVPKCLRNEDGILIGHTINKGVSIPISIPTDNDDTLFNTTVFFGSPRVGKDTAQCNYIIEAVTKANCGAIIPDVINEPIRGMADTIRNSLPPDKIVDIDLCDLNYSLYFGLDDIVSSIGVDLISNDIVKILELEDKLDSKQLCRLVARANNCNLYDMYCFLSSDIYANKVLGKIKKENELLALELQHKYFDKKGTSDSKTQAKKAVLTRLDDFMSLNIVKRMFAQKPNDKFNLKNLIAENKVVILRMTKTGGLGEMACRMLMYLLTVKVFWLKKIMLREYPNAKTFIVFNEFHQFLSSGFEATLTDMLFEAPKYKLGTLLCLHSPDKISKNLWSMIQSASTSIFLFKNSNYQVYKDLKDQLGNIDLQMAVKTERFEAIFLPYINKQLSPLFCKMIPPPIDRSIYFNNEYLTKEHTKKYGTITNEIKDYILKREIDMYKEISIY